MKKKVLNLLLVLALVVTLFGVFATPTRAAPADCFWVGDGGNWSDAATHWAIVSGGAPGAANLPDATSNVHFDGNSFTIGAQTVTVDATANCLDMDWTGATNTPTLAGSSTLNIYGSLTLIAAMTRTFTGRINFVSIAVGKTVTMAGNALAGIVSFEGGGGGWTLQDAFNMGISTLYFQRGTINTNGQAVTCGSILISTAAATTLTLGASIIDCTRWDYYGALLTLTANTATINVSGTGAVALGAANYNGADFNLNGTAHTVSGSPTGIAILATPPATTQTLTITAGSVILCVTATLSGDATHAHTILSGTAGTLAQIWATNKTDNFVTYTDILRNYNGVIVSDCTGAGGGTFAGAGGVYTSMTIQGAGDYALIITGSNTFTDFTVDASLESKTITFTDGTNQTTTNASITGSAAFPITLQGSGVAGWTITKAGGSYILCDYLDLSYSTGAPIYTWGYGFNSVIGPDVIDWGVPIFYIKIDGVEEDIEWAPGVSVPGNANDWTFIENGVMPYMEYHRITVGGTLQQYIVWQYDTTFTDQSGQGHDATPSFAVDSSDPHITASLLSYGPVSEADAPAYTIGAPPDFITTTPNLTGDFSTTIAPTIPGADVITAAAASSGTPVQLPWIMISAFVIMSLSLTATYVMSHFGSGNSVFVKISLITVGIGVLIGTGVFDFWLLLFFLIPAIAIAWASRPQESLG